MIKDFYQNLKNLDLTQNLEEYYGIKLSIFEKFLVVFLSSNTKKEKVLKTIEILRQNNVNEENILDFDIALLIKSSGFYNTKAKKIRQCLSVIKNDFFNLENFITEGSKDYLMEIKGISSRASDCILCFVCHKDILPLNSSFSLIAKHLGYNFETYEELQDIFEPSLFEIMQDLNINPKNQSINQIAQNFYFGVINFCHKYYFKNDFSNQAKDILKTALQ